LAHMGVKIMNDPRGIMHSNEKLYAYRSHGATPSFIGQNLKLAKEFVASLHTEHIILKPLDLFSGIGVEKLNAQQWEKRFEEKVIELAGPVILQPFIEEVTKGEIRSIYFKGQELGAILKLPKEGEFLSNIAQGATFRAEPLSKVARERAEPIVKELLAHGVDWVAFDILADTISEVNITCPGLLVEVSFAHQKNLADEIIDLLLKN
jgi:glutathione synthase